MTQSQSFRPLSAVTLRGASGAVRAVAAIFLVAACGDGGGYRTRDRPSGSLHGVCDSALRSTAAPESGADVRLAIVMTDSVALPEQIGRVGDLIATSDGQRIFLLDRSNNARIADMARDGTIRGFFGRRGRGPGELEFRRASSATARMALFGDTLLVVLDERSLKAYAMDGEVRWDRLVPKASTSVTLDGMHLSVAGPRTLRFTESGKYRFADSARAVRTALEFQALDLVTFSKASLFRAENSWTLATGPHIVEVPVDRPYVSEYGRAWDGGTDGVVLYSYHQYGVCFFDADGHLRSAFARRMEPPRIDAAERNRAMSAAFGGWSNPDARMPFLHRSPREIFEGHWPAHGPYYTDIVADGGRTVLVLRRVDAGHVLIDVYEQDTGYVGSFSPPQGVLPKRVSNGEALVVSPDELVLIAYRWIAAND